MASNSGPSEPSAGNAHRYADRDNNRHTHAASPFIRTWSALSRTAPAPADDCIGGNVPTTTDQCKKGGWMTGVRGDGSTFKNQGDCMQYVNRGK